MMAAGCLVFADGCKKQEPSEWKTLGTRVSMSELRQAFKDASGDGIQSCLSDVTMGVHYGEYTKALAALEKLANQPGLTARQKKAISEVTSQVKELAMKYQKNNQAK